MINRSHIEYAAQRCIELEENDACEHAVALNKDGEQVFEHHGDKIHVDFTKYDENQMLKKVHTVVHNHPKNEENPDGGATLSMPDMMFARTHDLEIWAVGANGNRFWSSGFVNDVSNVFSSMAVSIEYREMGETVSTELARMIKLFGNQADYNEIVGHVVNLMARKTRMIDYHWELSEKTQAVFDRYLPFINSRAGGDIFEIDSEEKVKKNTKEIGLHDLFDIVSKSFATMRNK